MGGCCAGTPPRMELRYKHDCIQGISSKRASASVKAGKTRRTCTAAEHLAARSINRGYYYISNSLSSPARLVRAEDYC